MKTIIPKKKINLVIKRNNWEELKGMWKNKKPDPILTWKKLRKEWDRKLPKLKIPNSIKIPNSK